MFFWATRSLETEEWKANVLLTNSCNWTFKWSGSKGSIHKWCPNLGGGDPWDSDFTNKGSVNKIRGKGVKKDPQNSDLICGYSLRENPPAMCAVFLSMTQWATTRIRKIDWSILVFWWLRIFIMRQVNFNSFLHPNEPLQKIFWYLARQLEAEPSKIGHSFTK